MDFKIKNGEQIRTVKAVKDSATVIEAGDLVALSAGLIIKATAGSTSVAYAPNGAAAGTTEIDVTVGNDFTLVGNADAAHAAADRGALADVAVSNGAQLVDVSGNSTDVLKVAIGEDAGVVGSTSDVEVRINKPLF